MDNVQTVFSHPFAQEYVSQKAGQLCRRSSISKSDYDDLRQEMLMHLFEKAHWYDPDRGAVEAFIIEVVNSWVCMHLRDRPRCDWPMSEAISLDTTMVLHEEVPATLGSMLLEESGGRLSQTYPISDTEQFELRDAIDQTMKELEPEDRQLLLHVVEHGVASAARTHGLTCYHVRKRLKELRPFFEKKRSRYKIFLIRP